MSKNQRRYYLVYILYGIMVTYYERQTLLTCENKVMSNTFDSDILSAVV